MNHNLFTDEHARQTQKLFHLFIYVKRKQEEEITTITNIVYIYKLRPYVIGCMSQQQQSNNYA